MEAGLGDDIDLNGWVSTRVINGTSVDLGDSHVDPMESRVWLDFKFYEVVKSLAIKEEGQETSPLVKQPFKRT